MTTLYRCSRCGRIVEINTDGAVPKCQEIHVTFSDYSDPIIETIGRCGGKLEPASKGKNDVQESDNVY